MLALILGLIVVSLSLYFIFHEYFTEEDIDWEQCRQSLLLRSKLPEVDLKVATISSKGSLPLMCGTKAFNIDYEDVDKAEELIAETIASSWYMIGAGEWRFFPEKTWNSGQLEIPCMILARVHMSDEVKDYYVWDKTIDIARALNSPMRGYSGSYWQYLNPIGGRKAFSYFREWSKDGFSFERHREWSLWSLAIPDEVDAFNIPRIFNASKGDLFVVYAHPTTKHPGEDGETVIKPYMILVQEEDFGKLSDEKWVKYNEGSSISGYAKVCSSIETVPS
jgi:hypothetical protein